ncbi:hypothetical protein ABPG73_008666 [Tetrahymena malaccensis]
MIIIFVYFLIELYQYTKKEKIPLNSQIFNNTQTDSQITKAAQLLQEEIIKIVKQLQGQDKQELVSLDGTEKAQTKKDNIQEDNESEPEIITKSKIPKIKQFDLIQDKGKFQIKQIEETIQLLLGDYYDKKCIVTSFLGLKGCGKTTLAQEQLNLIDPTIPNEEFQQMKKNKQNVSCFMIEKNDIIYLVIDSLEPFEKCKGQDNLSEIVSQLLLQTTIELIKENIINGLKQLEKFIFGSINQNSMFIFNRLTDFEYQSLTRGDCKIKTIVNNYKKIQYVRVRVNSEFCNDSLGGDDPEKQSKENNQTNKNGFIEDIKILLSIQGEEKKQTVNDFIAKLKHCQGKSERVSQLTDPLSIFIKPTIDQLKDCYIERINHEIDSLKTCSEVSQSLLDHLKQEIVEAEKQLFLDQLKDLIVKLKEIQKLRQNLICIYSQQFTQKKLLEELEILDQQEVKEIQIFQNFDFFKETHSLLYAAKQQHFHPIYAFLPFLGHIFYQCYAKTFNPDKSKDLKQLVTQTYTLYQQKSYLTKNDAENIIEKIILISKYVEQNKNTQIPKFEVEQKIDKILNLYDLGQKLFQDTQLFYITKQDINQGQDGYNQYDKTTNLLQQGAMDKSQFYQIFKDQEDFNIDIPEIQLCDESKLKITSHKVTHSSEVIIKSLFESQQNGKRNDSNTQNDDNGIFQYLKNKEESMQIQYVNLPIKNYQSGFNIN